MKRNFSRRAFLQGSAAAAAGGVLVSKTICSNAQPLRGQLRPATACASE